MLCNVTTFLIPRYCHEFTELPGKVKNTLFHMMDMLTD